MSTGTSIEWTNATWNPVRGCARVSAGCEHCYAERTAHRFGQPGSPYEGLTTLGQHGPRWVGRARFVPEMLGEPLRWKKSRRVFVNSMSDLFHEDVTNEQIAAVFGVMASCERHTFQVLTKRPDRMQRWFEWVSDQYPGARTHVLSEALAEEIRTGHNSEPLHTKHCADPDGPWPLSNVWLGVSCENQEAADRRIPLLLDCPAAVRFVSAEPLLGSLNLEHVQQDEVYAIDALRGDVSQGQLIDHGCIDHLDWVIVGGESGPGARSCDAFWIRCIIEQCERAKVACFVKQFGSSPIAGARRMRLRDKKGGDPSEWPKALRVRQFPEARP